MIPPRVSAFAARVGLTGLVIAVLVALLAVQTVRLEGFKLWPFSIEGAGPKAARLQRTIDDIDKAQKEANRRLREAKEAAERNYRDLAERIDDDAETARAGAMDDAERFIAANRVRCPANRSVGSGTPPTARDNGAGSGESPGAAPELDGVVVQADDVRICTTNTLQAEAARAWALVLEAN